MTAADSVSIEHWASEPEAQWTPATTHELRFGAERLTLSRRPRQVDAMCLVAGEAATDRPMLPPCAKLCDAPAEQPNPQVPASDRECYVCGGLGERRTNDGAWRPCDYCGGRGRVTTFASRKHNEKSSEGAGGGLTMTPDALAPVTVAASDGSAIVWTSQKFGPAKEHWSPDEIAEWERDCHPLEWCECGARMTGGASAEWLGEKCGDCRDWNAIWNGEEEEESPNDQSGATAALVGKRVVWRGMEAGIITRAQHRDAGGPLVDVRLDAGDSVYDLTEGEWEAMPNDQERAQNPHGGASNRELQK